MRQLLAPVLALHWMTVFALAAGLLALGGSDRVAALFALMGVFPHTGGLPIALGGAGPLVLSIGFALVSVLCLWVALDGAVGAERKGDEGRDVALGLLVQRKVRDSADVLLVLPEVSVAVAVKLRVPVPMLAENL